ncbi:Csu type fimbrial protein [Serratia fonticola]|uniref:Csu type fimbrial protein n=1 Tax=Serratia fonticola TaxID=47917 RepID=UPI0004114FB9|nr:spore coat U domain-containing protein [Serratia fonticola]
MRTITLHFLLLVLSLTFVPSTWAVTLNWSRICDISWTDEVVDFTAGGAVSPLDLADTPQDYSQAVHVWCYEAPDITSGDAQHMGLVVEQQHNSATSFLAMSANQANQSLLPFVFCLGNHGSNLLCVDTVNKKLTYNWGTDASVPSLMPQIFQKVTDGEMPDDCATKGTCGKGRVLPIPKGPYVYVAHVHITTDPKKISLSPPIPGAYSDKITLRLDGQVASGRWWSPDINIGGNNNPTVTLAATLKDDCRIINTPDVHFDGAFSSELTQTQDITLRCTNTTPYTISFQGENDSIGWHQMKSQTSDTFLRYQMYKDELHTQVWDANQAAGEGNGKEQKLRVFYATDPSQQNVPAGSYKDTVTMTLSY